MIFDFLRNPPYNKFLLEVGTKNQRHGQRTLYDHLVGTWKLLKGWGCSREICNAGLFHSIYGTQVYLPSTIPIKNRKVVQDLIGKSAENLVYLFHITPPNRFEYFVTMREPERSKLMTISYANDMEQSEKNWDDLRFHPYLLGNLKK